MVTPERRPDAREANRKREDVNYSGMRWSELAKIAAKALAGTSIIYYLSTYLTGTLPEFAALIGVISLVSFIGWSGKLAVDGAQVIKEFSNPLLKLGLDGEIARLDGMKLANLARLKLAIKVGDAPLTFEQAIREFEEEMSVEEKELVIPTA